MTGAAWLQRSDGGISIGEGERAENQKDHAGPGHAVWIGRAPAELGNIAAGLRAHDHGKAGTEQGIGIAFDDQAGFLLLSAAKQAETDEQLGRAEHRAGKPAAMLPVIRAVQAFAGDTPGTEPFALLHQGGGEMIDKVSWEGTTFERLPFKFEAGTPDFVATHGLATAIDYLDSLGLEKIEEYESSLTRYCLKQLQTLDGIAVYGPSEQRDAVISFNMGEIHHLDVGTLLDRLGIAVRTGHHCAQPLMERLGVSGTVRASFALYNTKDEVDALVAALRRIQQMF